jgi:nucleoside-diphosphate-sugar epimerase
MRRIVAITGATGFLGRYIVRAFAGSGWRVRILARQPIDHPQLAGLQLEVVLRDLSNRQALRTLVDGADVIVHAAGLIKARTPAAFEAVNVRGTANLAGAIEERGSIARVLLVSSMAAREPELSTYARTKRAAEQLLMAVLNRRCQLTIVRPCAIYGPWDRETLTIFRAVQYHIFLRPRIAHGRIAVIHAADAAAAIAVLCEQSSCHSMFELTDERTPGYSWNEIVGAAETAMNSKALVIPLPRPAVRATAAAVWLPPAPAAHAHVHSRKGARDSSCRLGLQGRVPAASQPLASRNRSCPGFLRHCELVSGSALARSPLTPRGRCMN